MRAARIHLTVLACVLLAACFEEPVREHINIHLGRDEAVVITAVQEVAEPEIAEDNPELERRLEEARDAIERGWDRWSQRFGELAPRAERQVLERVDGAVRRAVHSAAVTDARSLEDFFVREGVVAVITDGSGYRELLLDAGGSTRATSRQQDLVEARLDDWAAVVASYLEAAITVYQHLDRRPDRAVPCLSHVFDKHDEQSGPLSEWEEEAVTRLKKSLEEVSEALMIGAGEAHSLNELSRLVYDPFPARLTITLAAPLLEVDGLASREGYFERPPVDLWRALEGLEGRWLEPDLVTAMVAPVPQDQQPDPDPVDFAGRPRWFSDPPTAAEVAAALRAELVPAAGGRLRWRFEPSEEELDPRGLLNAAETALPR